MNSTSTHNASTMLYGIDLTTTESFLTAWIAFGLCLLVNVALIVQAIRRYNIFRLFAVIAGIGTLVLAATLLAATQNINLEIWNYINIVAQIVSFDLFVVIFIQLGVRFYPPGMAITPVCLLTITSAITINCILIYAMIERIMGNPQPTLMTYSMFGEVITNFLTAYYVFSPLISTAHGKVIDNPETHAVGLWYITLLTILNLANMIFIAVATSQNNQFKVFNICIGYLFRIIELLVYTLPPVPAIKNFICHYVFNYTSQTTKSALKPPNYPQGLNSLIRTSIDSAHSNKPILPSFGPDPNVQADHFVAIKMTTISKHVSQKPQPESDEPINRIA